MFIQNIIFDMINVANIAYIIYIPYVAYIAWAQCELSIMQWLMASNRLYHSHIRFRYVHRNCMTNCSYLCNCSYITLTITVNNI